MSNPRRPPFAKGDPRAAEYGAKGGRSRRTPKYEAALARLSRLTIGEWMTRLQLVEETWTRWRIIGKVLDGEPFTPAELEAYTQLTGRTTVPAKHRLRIVWALIGRGGGKTTFFAVVAVQAAVQRYTLKTPAHVLFLAFVKDQASIAFDLVREWFAKDADLKRLVRSSRRDRLELHNNVILATITSNWRMVRGYSVACAVADESAFWWVEAENRNPDREVFRALLPALGKVRGSRLLCPTTPFGRQGQAFEAHERHYGRDDSDVLVIKAPTLVMHPAFDRAVIEAMELEDPENAASEFDVQWRADREGFVRLEVLEAAIDGGVTERAPAWERAA